MRRQEGDKYKRIFGILVNPQSLAPGFPCHARSLYSLYGYFEVLRLPHQTGRVAYNERFSCMRPDRDVSRPISDIVEAALTKRFDQRNCLGPAGEIVHPIRCEDAIEEADMLGNFLSVRSVTGRGEINFLAFALRLTNELQNVGIARKRRVVDCGNSAEIGFDLCLATNERPDHRQMMADPSGDRRKIALIQQIGPD